MTLRHFVPKKQSTAQAGFAHRILGAPAVIQAAFAQKNWYNCCHSVPEPYKQQEVQQVHFIMRDK